MGRSPCCSKEGLNRGAWTALEDKILTDYIKAHGEGKWRNLPKRAGLKRCGKSCRLRWLNYLRPDIKRGNISSDEEELIIRLHRLLGNRWSLIAGRLPGRTDNEIKNYWNTTLGKKADARSSQPESKQISSRKSRQENLDKEPGSTPKKLQPNASQSTRVIHTKPTRLSAVPVTLQTPVPQAQACSDTSTAKDLHQDHSINNPQNSPDGPKVYCEPGDQPYPYHDNLDFLSFGLDEFQSNGYATMGYDFVKDLPVDVHEAPLSVDDLAFTDLTGNYNFLDNNTTLDLESLSFLLESEDWSLK